MSHISVKDNRRERTGLFFVQSMNKNQRFLVRDAMLCPSPCSLPQEQKAHSSGWITLLQNGVSRRWVFPLLPQSWATSGLGHPPSIHSTQPRCGVARCCSGGFPAGSEASCQPLYCCSQARVTVLGLFTEASFWSILVQDRLKSNKHYLPSDLTLYSRDQNPLFSRSVSQLVDPLINPLPVCSHLPLLLLKESA